MPANTTVLVVEDDDSVRESIAALLQSEGYYAVKGYASGRLFLEDPAAIGQCVILDIRMPGIDGFAVLEEMARRETAMPVVVMTGHGDVSVAVRAMKAGAIDFVEKPFSNEALLDAVRRALDIGAQVRNSAATVIGAQTLISGLSAREREVLDQLVAGRPSKIVGYNLGISHRTVEVHRAHITAKLKAHSLSEVIYTALIAQRDSGTFRSSTPPESAGPAMRPR